MQQSINEWAVCRFCLKLSEWSIQQLSHISYTNMVSYLLVCWSCCKASTHNCYTSTRRELYTRFHCTSLYYDLQVMKSQCEPGSKAIYTADDRTWNHSLIWSLKARNLQGWHWLHKWRIQSNTIQKKQLKLTFGY